MSSWFIACIFISKLASCNTNYYLVTPTTILKHQLLSCFGSAFYCSIICPKSHKSIKLPYDRLSPKLGRHSDIHSRLCKYIYDLRYFRSWQPQHRSVGVRQLGHSLPWLGACLYCQPNNTRPYYLLNALYHREIFEYGMILLAFVFILLMSDR